MGVRANASFPDGRLALCMCAHKQKAETEKTRIKYQRLVKKVTTIEEYYAHDSHYDGLGHEDGLLRPPTISHDLPRRPRHTTDHDRS